MTFETFRRIYLYGHTASMTKQCQIQPQHRAGEFIPDIQTGFLWQCMTSLRLNEEALTISLQGIKLLLHPAAVNTYEALRLYNCFTCTAF